MAARAAPSSTARSAQANLCTSVRSAGCRPAAWADSTWCLPLAASAGAAFGALGPAGVAGNGCPEQRGFDVVAPMASAPGRQGEPLLPEGGAPADYASVTNEVIGGFTWRRWWMASRSPRSADRRPIPTRRRSAAKSAVYERTLEVLTWLATP